MANNRRDAIIKAAQEILAVKGIEDSSISEIAKKAGVVDSIIYHYFKNKEDLLFYALEARMTAIARELELHLEGILDPISKLGKMIWFHLHIYDLRAENTLVLKNLLFECRSKKSFYSHEGYKSLRSYTGILIQILKYGVDEGVFRSNLNLFLIRDMIFGLLDEESLNCYAVHETEKTLPDFSGIMELVLAMVVNHEDKQEELAEDKEAKILGAAEQIFAQKGYHSATMSEVAKTAGVAEGTIYTYFENKKDLLLSISVKRFRRFKEDTVEIFNIKDTLRKLRRMIRYNFSIFLTNRNFLSIFLLDIKLNREFYASPAYNEFLNYISVLDPVLEEGKEKGVFRKSVNNRIFRNLFFGAFIHLATRWFILRRAKPIDMMQEIDELVHLLCRAVIKK